MLYLQKRRYLELRSNATDLYIELATPMTNQLSHPLFELVRNTTRVALFRHLNFTIWKTDKIE